MEERLFDRSVPRMQTTLWNPIPPQRELKQQLKVEDNARSSDSPWPGHQGRTDLRQRRVGVIRMERNLNPVVWFITLWRAQPDS